MDLKYVDMDTRIRELNRIQEAMTSFWKNPPKNADDQKELHFLQEEYTNYSIVPAECVPQYGVWEGLNHVEMDEFLSDYLESSYVYTDNHFELVYYAKLTNGDEFELGIGDCVAVENGVARLMLKPEEEFDMVAKSLSRQPEAVEVRERFEKQTKSQDIVQSHLYINKATDDLEYACQWTGLNHLEVHRCLSPYFQITDWSQWESDAMVLKNKETGGYIQLPQGCYLVKKDNLESNKTHEMFGNMLVTSPSTLPAHFYEVMTEEDFCKAYSLYKREVETELEEDVEEER